jgi:DNA-3-methyladenine glycosylase II
MAFNRHGFTRNDSHHCERSKKEIILTNNDLLEGVEFLSQIDADLATIFRDLGAPPLWKREPGFPTLVYIILEQQVSLASAKAAFQKLNQSVKTLTPQTFIHLSDPQLKKIGFSRQKAGYCRGLAAAILDGKLNLESLHPLDDQAARSALMGIKGIGRWTADIYLLMALLRPDIWPAGDLALVTGIQHIKRLPTRPTQDEMEQIAEPWRPWRAVAARLVWLYYLNERNRARTSQ